MLWPSSELSLWESSNKELQCLFSGMTSQALSKKYELSSKPNHIWTFDSDSLKIKLFDFLICISQSFQEFFTYVEPIVSTDGQIPEHPWINYPNVLKYWDT